MRPGNDERQLSTSTIFHPACLGTTCSRPTGRNDSAQRTLHSQDGTVSTTKFYNMINAWGEEAGGTGTCKRVVFVQNGPALCANGKKSIKSIVIDEIVLYCGSLSISDTQQSPSKSYFWSLSGLCSAQWFWFYWKISCLCSPGILGTC